MFKHILLPIDGSDFSLRAAEIGIELARGIHARVHAFHVLAPFAAVSFMAELIQHPESVYTQNAVERAERYIDEVRQRARKAGVAFDSGYTFDHRPYCAIVGAANKLGCDLIVMASHGRHGVERLLLGSETHKVIQTVDIPVLVCH